METTKYTANGENRNEKHDIIKMSFNGLLSRLDTTKEIISKSKETLLIFLMPKPIFFHLQYFFFTFEFYNFCF